MAVILGLILNRSVRKKVFLSALSLLLLALIHSPALAAENSNAGGDSGDSINRPIKDKWAVIIGVSKFSNPDIPVLKYPAKDAKDFAQFLTSKGNFAKDHVLLLTDEKATKVQILDAFGDGWLPRRVMEDDLVVIFISSHGSPADSAGENFIIAYDSDPNHPYATGIRLQDLSAEITKRTGCDRVVLLLDACHSGAATVGAKGLQRTLTNFELDKIAGVGQLIISSSKSDEVSWESKRYPNSVFTRSLIDSLQAKGNQTSVADAYDHLKDKVQAEVRFDRVTSQTPVMLSKWKGQELALCAPPSDPRQVLPELNETVIASAPLRPYSSPVSQSSTIIPQAKPSSAQPAIKASKPEIAVSSTKTMMLTDWQNNAGDPTLESGTRLLAPAELSKLNTTQLLCLYNEAYARHGRGFLMNTLQDYFASQPWYKQDPDYHWRASDPKVISRNGRTDDNLVINERRTPKQWTNMQLIKLVMDRRNSSK